MSIPFNIQKIRSLLISDGITHAGALAISDDANAVYFISDTSGTSITLKDNAGKTLYDAVNAPLSGDPIRFDKGFDISGTKLTFKYVRVTVMADADNII
jgi:hypothetical protein